MQYTSHLPFILLHKHIYLADSYRNKDLTEDLNHLMKLYGSGRNYRITLSALISNGL